MRLITYANEKTIGRPISKEYNEAMINIASSVEFSAAKIYEVPRKPNTAVPKLAKAASRFFRQSQVAKTAVNSKLAATSNKAVPCPVTVFLSIKKTGYNNNPEPIRVIATAQTQFMMRHSLRVNLPPPHYPYPCRYPGRRPSRPKRSQWPKATRRSL